jgi:hypothetical protein
MKSKQGKQRGYPNRNADTLASVAQLNSPIAGTRIRREESHVRDWARGRAAHDRYGHAHDVLLEADRNLSSVCHHHRVLHRGLLHRKHNWAICNLIEGCLAGILMKAH